MKRFVFLSCLMTTLLLMSSVSFSQTGIQTAKFRTPVLTSKQIGTAACNQITKLSNNQIVKSSIQSKGGLTKAYCYIGYDASNTLPNGPAYTFLERPDSIVSLANQSKEDILSAGTWGGADKWYGAVMNQNNLITIDPVTGSRTKLGNIGVSILGLAYDYTTASLYGISVDGTNNSTLYKINQTTGAATMIGLSLNGVLINLICNSTGSLYSVNITNDSLYSIDKTTGAATGIGQIGFDANYIQGMEFDLNTNTCYMAAYNNTDSQGELRTIDLTSGATTLIGAFQGKAEITALAIPSHILGKTNDVSPTIIEGKSLITPKTIAPKAALLNLGFDASFNVTMKISDGYSSTISVSDLAPYDDKLISFDQWIPAPGEYTMTVYTDFASDVNISNDTIRKTVSVQNLKKVFCNIGYDPSGALPIGPAYTFLQRPDSIVSIAKQASESLINDGCWANDKWYGVADSTLITINIGTGARTVIGNLKATMIGLSYDITTASLYGISYDNNAKHSSLFKINPANGKSTLIGVSSNQILINLACDTLGNLYSLNIDDDAIYSVNKTTGVATSIGPIGFDASYLQSMQFDHNTNICYMAAYNVSSGQGELRTVDLKTGSTTYLGTFAGKSEITSFAIPYLTTNINDVAATTISGRPIITPSTMIPKAGVINLGINATFNVTMKISDGYTSTKTVSNLYPYGDIQLAFDPWTPVIGNYTITVYSELNGDVNKLNDTIRKTVSVQNLTTAYCYVSYDPSSTIPNGPAYTYLQTPDLITSIADQSSSPIASGAAWGPENKWYASTFADKLLVSFDTLTGARTVIGSTTLGMLGIAYDYTTATMYGMGFDGIAYSSLYKINKETGASTLIGRSLNDVFLTLACDYLGNLYAVNQTDNSLYSINKQSGIATRIGDVGFDVNYLQGMSYDYNTHICYMAAYNNTTQSGELRIINLTTAETTLIGEFAGKSEITGFAIPYHFTGKYFDVKVVTIDELPIMPLQSTSPKAFVMNKGIKASFNVTMKISDGYISTKTINNLAPNDGLQVTFDNWTPTATGEYTITVYTDLPGDIDILNDTLHQAISVRNLTKAYCYINSDPTGLLPVGPAYIYLEAPLLITSIADQTPQPIISRAVWGRNNKWFGFGKNTLFSFDTITGSRIKSTKLDRKIEGMAFDYSTNTLYGIGNEGPETNLYIISVATGVTNLIGPCKIGNLINLTIDNTGVLYAISLNDSLCTINKSTGAGSRVAYLDLSSRIIRDMQFNFKTNVCYLTAYNTDNKLGEIRTLNLTTGHTVELGSFADRLDIEATGLAIPYNHSIPLHDVGVTVQTSPVSGCSLDKETVAVKVENMGSKSVSNIPVHYILDNKTTVDTILTANLQPEEYISLNFNKQANLATSGFHTIKAFTTHPSDLNTFNDSMKYTVNNILVSGIPFSLKFEPTESGWHIADGNNDGNKWYIAPKGGTNNSYSAQFSSNPGVNSDDYLFTKCIQLEKAKTYNLSFSYKCEKNTSPEALITMLFSAPEITSYVSLISDLHSVTNTDYKLNTTNFTVPNSGVYFIAFRCYSWSGLRLYLDDINISDVTAIDELTKHDALCTIYPNPAKDLLNIVSNEDIKLIRIENIFGQLISQFNIQNSTFKILSTSELSEGVYFIRIESASAITTRKFVISR